MTLLNCFVCGCDWACGHREPELIAHYVRLVAAATKLQHLPEATDSRKPPAAAPSAPIREIRPVKRL